MGLHKQVRRHDAVQPPSEGNLGWSRVFATGELAHHQPVLQYHYVAN